MKDVYKIYDIEQIPKYTKIVGNSFKEQQQYISKLEINDYLYLKREYHNPYDKCAILVMKNNLKLGYIPKYISKKLASQLDNLIYYHAIVENITGKEQQNKGVNIQIIFDKCDI